MERPQSDKIVDFNMDEHGKKLIFLTNSTIRRENPDDMKWFGQSLEGCGLDIARKTVSGKSLNYERKFARPILQQTLILLGLFLSLWGTDSVKRLQWLMIILPALYQ